MHNDVSLDEALRFIADCERRAEPILGLEWFQRTGGTVTPAGILDLSTAPPATTWNEARTTLADGIPNGANTVEVVTGDSAAQAS